MQFNFLQPILSAYHTAFRFLKPAEPTSNALRKSTHIPLISCDLPIQKSRSRVRGAKKNAK